MRVTYHNGRAGKDGVYSPSHNDRQFDYSKSDHIDPDKVKDNYYKARYSGMDFTQSEIRYYEEHYRRSLDARNARYMSQRHPERCKTMDEYRTSPKTSPEETIIMIGKKGDTVDMDALKAIIKSQIEWEQRQYPQVKILDLAIHQDEQGAPHVHVRKVYEADSKDGKCVNMIKSLAQMGVERPDPTKPTSRYNCAKMTYTKSCIMHLQQLCIDRGLQIELTPKEPSKSGLTLLEYQAQQEREKLAIMQMQSDSLSKTMHVKHQELDTARHELADVQRQVDDTRQGLQELVDRQTLLQAQSDSLDKTMHIKRQELDTARHELADIQRQLYQADMSISDHELMYAMLVAIGSADHKLMSLHGKDSYMRKIMEVVKSIYASIKQYAFPQHVQAVETILQQRDKSHSKAREINGFSRNTTTKSAELTTY